MAEIASGSIDLKSLKVAGEPNKYITYINDEGIRIHEAGAVNTNFAQINATGMQIYSGGQTDDYKVAEFGSTIQIGKTADTHLMLDDNSIQGANSVGSTVLNIGLSDATLNTWKTVRLSYSATVAPDASKTFTVSEITQYVTNGQQFKLIIFIKGIFYNTTLTFTYGASKTIGSLSYNGTTGITFSNTASTNIDFSIKSLQYIHNELAPSWTFGSRIDGTIGGYSFVHGFNNEASGNYSHAEGNGTTASGNYSHAEGGNGTTASGNYSHAEGNATEATNEGAHAEGFSSEANGYSAHAEGYWSIASAHYSHAEGYRSQATAIYSHAQGLNTIASKFGQTTLGTYNIEDTSSTTTHPSGTIGYGQYAVIIGNGTSSTRSNALTVEWNGNVNIASGAKYQINGTALSASDVGAVPTSRTVNSKALSSNITLSASDVSAIALSDKYIRSSSGGLDWSTQADGEAKVLTKSALAYWNGTYNGTNSNLTKSAAGTIIGRNQICYANSRVDTFSSGQITIANSSLGVTTGAKPVGIILTPEYGTAVIMKYNYDSSNATNSIIQCWNHDGTAYNGAMRYFAVVFQNTWTTT